jgi:hypothetical protein
MKIFMLIVAAIAVSAGSYRALADMTCDKLADRNKSVDCDKLAPAAKAKCLADRKKSENGTNADVR